MWDVSFSKLILSRLVVAAEMKQKNVCLVKSSVSIHPSSSSSSVPVSFMWSAQKVKEGAKKKKIE